MKRVILIVKICVLLFWYFRVPFPFGDSLHELLLVQFYFHFDSGVFEGFLKVCGRSSFCTWRYGLSRTRTQNFEVLCFVTGRFYAYYFHMHSSAYISVCVSERD